MGLNPVGDQDMASPALPEETAVPDERRLTVESRVVTTILAGIAGFAGLLLFVGRSHTEATFAWKITDPLTATTLGAAYLAGAVMLGFAAASGRWADARLALGVTGLMSGLTAWVTWTTGFDANGDAGYLLLAALAWVWVNTLLPVVVLLVAIYHHTAPGPVGVRRQELPLPLALLLVPPALVAAYVGAGLLGGSGADMIPWATTSLEARLIGALALTVAVAALAAVLERDVARLRGLVWAALTLGALLLLVAVQHREQLGFDDRDALGYQVTALTLVGVGLAGLVLRFLLPDGDWWARRVRGTSGRRRGSDGIDQLADQGFFGPDSVAWRVWSYPTSLTVGFQRAVVVEELDPFLVASVDATQEIRTNAKVRYDHTIRYFATVAFADSRTAVKASQALMKVHARNTGIEPISGQRYDANNPDSQLWILLTGWHSVLKAYEMYGPGRLTDAEEEQFWAECAVAAQLQTCDPAKVPLTREGVREYFEAVRPGLVVSPVAVDTMDYLLQAKAVFPKVPFFLAPFFWVVNRSLRAAVIASLPDWVREETELDQPRILDRLVAPVMRLSYGVVSRSNWLSMRVLGMIAPGAVPIAAPVYYAVPAKQRRTWTPEEAFAMHEVPTPAQMYGRRRPE